MHPTPGAQPPRRVRTALALAVGAAAALLAAGCASEPAVQAAPDDAPTNAAVELLPADIAASGELSAASFLNYPPYHYVSEDGKPAGINPTLAQAVADYLGLTLSIEDVPFESLVASVQSGRYDVALTTNAISPERLEAVDILAWKKSTFRVLTAVGNPKDLDIDDLCGVSFAVTAGSTNELATEALSAQCEELGKSRLEVLLVPDGLTEALVSGRVDALVNDAASALAEVEGRPDQLEVLDDLLPVPGFDENPAGWMFPKGSDIEPAIESAIAALIEDGTWQRILGDYGLTEAGYLPPVLYTEMPAEG